MPNIATIVNNLLADSGLDSTNVPSSAFPSQTGNNGKYLTTDGSAMSWGTVSTNNIYNSDGTLTASRDITLGGHNLTFIGSSFSSRFTAAGRLLLGTTTESTFILDAVGTFRFTNNINATSAIFQNIAHSQVVEIKSAANTTSQLRLSSATSNNAWGINQIAGNFLIGLVPDVGNGTFTMSVNRTNGNTLIYNSSSALYANAFSLLELSANNKGFLPTRMTETQLKTIAGAVTSVGIVNGGSGYTDGTYFNVPATVTSIYGTGSVAVSAVVSGGVVISLTTGAIPPYGTGYQIGDIITSFTGLSGGVGFQGKITGVTTPTSLIGYQTNNTEALSIHNSQFGWVKFLIDKGQLQLRDYLTTTSFTGTLVGYLGFDASGNILTAAAPGGGSNIYTADGTLTADRTLTHGGFNLTFIGSSFTSRFTASGKLLIGTTTEPVLHILDINGSPRCSGDFLVSTNMTVGRGVGTATSFNTIVGTQAVQNNTSGGWITAFGYLALRQNNAGNFNSAFGSDTLSSANGTSSNSAFGFGALRGLTSGNNNTAIGRSAGYFISGGTVDMTNSSDSIFIGHNSYALANSQTNQIVIGANAVGLGSNTTILGNSSTLLTSIAAGQLRLASYLTTTSYTGTLVGLLGFDASGNVLTVDPASSDTNIYNTDGTLTGNRTVTLGLNNLTFDGSAGGNIILSDATHIKLGTTTGTKFGTLTSEKLAFYGSNPIAQQTTSVTAGAFVQNSVNAVYQDSTFSGYTIGQIVEALRFLGLLA
jgi:hypothetical protein